MINIVSDKELEFFKTNGFLILKKFYEYDSQIQPIQEEIRAIIQLLLKKNPVPYKNLGLFDDGYIELIQKDRRIGSYIYDAVKQCSSFVNLLSSKENIHLYSALRNSKLVGIAGGGSGIRINNPLEEKYRAPWHQEYPAQGRSLDGLVYWSPLVNVTQIVGPVELCIGSHKAGLLPVYYEPESTKNAYGLRIANEESYIKAYERADLLVEVGDLAIFDFLTLHRSGLNKSSRALWSMQFRYFNFDDEVGQSILWSGVYAAGKRFEDLHPNYVVSINSQEDKFE
jgi:Phytanoyl-CoA dioxygenase (PhyH)